MGYDAGKKVKGRKINALVDTLGLPMHAVVHSAGLQDRDGGSRPRQDPYALSLAPTGLGERRLQRSPGQSGRSQVPALGIEIVERTDDMTGFVVLPRRWLVERPFYCFGRNRRLAKDYKNLADALLAFGLRHAGLHPIRPPETRAWVGF